MKKYIVIMIFLFSIILPCFANDCDINTCYDSGISKYKVKDYVGAIDDFTKAIELSSNDYKSYFNRGLSRYQLGSYRGSIVDVRYSGEIYNSLYKEKAKPLADSNDIYFRSYIKNLNRKIRQNWDPDEYGCSLNAEIIFKVDKSGNVKYMRLLKSSGNKKFDNEAILAFIKSVPFKALPKEFSGNSIEVKFNFGQRLNKF